MSPPAPLYEDQCITWNNNIALRIHLQQQPESTSTDQDHPDSSSKDISTPPKRNDNAILKQLLSQDDEVCNICAVSRENQP